MKIMIKEDKLISDETFRDCTAGAIYEAKMCENPLIALCEQLGIHLTEEDIRYAEEGLQCLLFQDDEGKDVYCTFEDVVIVKPEHY